MNESGRSISAAMRFYKAPVDAVLVVHDDVDLEFGRLQARAGGGLGGPQRAALDRAGARRPRTSCGCASASGARVAAIRATSPTSCSRRSSCTRTPSARHACRRRGRGGRRRGARGGAAALQRALGRRLRSPRGTRIPPAAWTQSPHRSPASSTRSPRASASARSRTTSRRTRASRSRRSRSSSRRSTARSRRRSSASSQRTRRRATSPRRSAGTSIPAGSHSFRAAACTPGPGLEPPAHLVGERARALDVLARGGLVCVSARALAEGIPPEQDRPDVVVLSQARGAGLDELVESLALAGYERVERVEERGQIAVRGGLVDVFPSTGREPLRIEFFGDELEQIRAFSPFTQRALHAIEEASISRPASGRTSTRSSPLLDDASETTSCPLLDRAPDVVWQLDDVSRVWEEEGLAAPDVDGRRPPRCAAAFAAARVRGAASRRSRPAASPRRRTSSRRWCARVDACS